MTVAAVASKNAPAVSTSLITIVNEGRPLMVPGRLWRGTVVVGDGLGALAVALCIPLAILALGTPIALSVRLLLWTLGIL